MRIVSIVIAALVSFVLLPTEPAAARPRGTEVAEAKKSRTKRKAKLAKKKARSKKARLAKAEKPEVEEAPPVARDPEPAPPPRVTKRASQVVDDEVPRNEPKKR